MTLSEMSRTFVTVDKWLSSAKIGRCINLRRPPYNADLAPPEVRGFFVALQQLSTTIGIPLSYWIAYGTTYISDTGEDHHAILSPSTYERRP
ncbi:hypothetical protein E4T43_02052 [Aureobasidium subglaciale]|nr:hypothetical protein E4T43_02052 [Aureobasidium subglaciale]